jgi:hypothetical protein
VVNGSALFEIRGLRCYLTHYCTDPHTVGEEAEPDLILFGHNPDVATRTPFLNGLFHIHVISLGSKEVIFLPYPAGTDSARKMLPPKIGL